MNSTATLLSVLALTGCAITEDDRSQAPLTDGGSGAGGTAGSSSSGGAGTNAMGGHAGIKDGAVAERDASAVCPQSIDDYCKTQTCQRTRPSDPRFACNHAYSDVFISGCDGPYVMYTVYLADGGYSYTYDTQSNQLVLIEMNSNRQSICLAGPSDGVPGRSGLKVCTH